MSRSLIKKLLVRLAGVVALAGLAVAFPSVSHADAVTDANLAAKVESAKTAADHQAIAQYFVAKAADSDKAAAMHESMLKNLATTGGKPFEVWRSHCEKLIQSYKELSADYKRLAAEQEALAKSAK